jgi:hypothetical protein
MALVPTKKCPHCGETGLLEIVGDQLRDFLDEEFLYDGIQYWDREDREQMVTGTHPDCYRAMNPED